MTHGIGDARRGPVTHADCAHMRAARGTRTLRRAGWSTQTAAAGGRYDRIDMVQPVRERMPAPLAESEQTAQTLVEQCLEAAIQLRASDVHVEPQADKLSIRLRVDGALKPWKEIPIDLHPQVIARLKILAKLDISEKRRAQDGRFTLAT